MYLNSSLKGKKMLEIKDIGNEMFIIKIVVAEVHTTEILKLKEELRKAISDQSIKKLIIDLSNVKMITSSGIGIFLNINEELNSNLRLAEINNDIIKVLELTKVSSVIKVFKTLDEAKKSF